MTASIVAPSASVSAYDNATQLPQCSARDSAADHMEKAGNGLHVLDIIGTGTGIGRAIPMHNIRDPRTTCMPILARRSVARRTGTITVPGGSGRPRYAQ